MIRRRLFLPASETVGKINFILFTITGNSATAYAIFIKMQDLYASKSEEHEKEGTNVAMNLSPKWQYISHMFLVSLCASLRSENDRILVIFTSLKKSANKCQ